MNIKWDVSDDEDISVVIDETEYGYGDRVTIPFSILSQVQISDIPCDVEIELCESINDNTICVDIPVSIRRINETSFEVSYNELITRKYWNGTVGLKLYMETKRNIIKERHEDIDDIELVNYDDDGAYINLIYNFSFEPNDIDDLLNTVRERYNEIEGATNIALGSPFHSIDRCTKESDFTVNFLLPIFRKLGFVNVKYNHGNREFGKDIVFARRTEFDELEYYGVQVKFGNVSGDAKGDVFELINQAHDAFSMPIYDVYTRSKVFVSKVVIAISGKFTQNAIEKIIDGIHDYPLKNNLIFIDGEKIKQLMEKIRTF